MLEIIKCPKCKSEDIETTDIIDDDEYSPTINYKCNSCQYNWAEALIKEEDI